MLRTVLLAFALDFLLKKDVVGNGDKVSMAPTRLGHEV